MGGTIGDLATPRSRSSGWSPSFAPLFFGSLGLRTDFLANFDLGLVLVVFAIACGARCWAAAGGALERPPCPRRGRSASG
jgi:hypothetical protein